jgi:ABC-type sugar transport system substrate-binding protein
MLRKAFAQCCMVAGAVTIAALTALADEKPAFISDQDWSAIKSKIDPARVQWNPYKGLAVKKDGSPYRVLDLRLWMGDDYQVVAHFLAQTQLESAGAKYALLSSEFDAPLQAHMLEDAVATRAYDAVLLHPLDREAMKVPVEKAIDAGIDVYDWVTPVPSTKLTGFVGYKADEMQGNGLIGQEFVKLAKEAGATPEHPFVVLEIWGIRSAPLCVERHNGLMMGIGGSPLVKVIESVDTAGQPGAQTKAIQDAFSREPNIKGIYPQFGDAGAEIEGLRSVGHLTPPGDQKHVYVILQDIDKAMLPALRDGTFHATVSNNPWHQIDVMVKQFMWHTVLKQPLGEGDYRTQNVKLPRTVLLPMMLLDKNSIDTPEAQVFGGTVAFTDMPLGKWNEWPVLDTSKIGLPTPTLADRKQMLGY